MLTTISVLDVLEWALILRAAPWRGGSRVPAGRAFLALGVFAVIVLAAGEKPIIAAALLAAAGIGLSRILPTFRVALGALALLVSQYVLTGWPFLALHNAVGRADAAVTRSLLHARHQTVVGAGSLVVLPERRQAYDVMWGCATSTSLVEILPAYLLIVLCLRGRIIARDGLWIAGLIVLVFPLNWLRLQLICGQPGGYAFWHEGQGAALLGALYGALAVGAAWAATRRQDPPR